MSHDETTTHKGAGLARGPALILGAILAAFGLILFIKCGDTQPTGGFPDGAAGGPHFLGFEANGWTAWLTTTGGALLLFGAAQHLLAKSMSLIVGLALGAAAIFAAVDGDVLGLAAANFWTEIGWAIAAVLLLFNLFAPRIEHTEDDRRVDGNRGGRSWPRRRRGVERTDGADRTDARPVTDREVTTTNRTAGTPDHPVEPTTTRDRDR
jgi:hypothetical protein